MLNSTKVQYLTASLMAWEMPTSNMMLKSYLFSNEREKTLRPLVRVASNDVQFGQSSHPWIFLVFCMTCPNMTG